jgi:hypothetical protein
LTSWRRLFCKTTTTARKYLHSIVRKVLPPISKNEIVCHLGQPTSAITLLLFQESMHLGLLNVPYFKDRKSMVFFTVCNRIPSSRSKSWIFQKLRWPRIGAGAVSVQIASSVHADSRCDHLRRFCRETVLGLNWEEATLSIFAQRWWPRWSELSNSAGFVQWTIFFCTADSR